MNCANFLLCGNDENKYNGVCYECDNSIFGYFGKHTNIYFHGLRPTIDNVGSIDYDQYISLKLTNEEQLDLLEKLKQHKDTTSIIKIEQINEECPICLEEKETFVTHPTCDIHKICIDCFRITFWNDLNEWKEAEIPEGYEIFSRWEDENDIGPGCCDIEHPPGKEYSYYVLEPKPEWPDHIKEIYPNVALYHQKEIEHIQEHDIKLEENENIRACNICRECNLKI